MNNNQSFAKTEKDIDVSKNGTIENINIIFSNNNGDICVLSQYINSISEEKLDNYYGVYKKLSIDFSLTNDPNNYEINSLLFHENKIEKIIVNYLYSPSIVYTKVQNKWDNEISFDYEFKILDTRNKELHTLLNINTTLVKNVIKYKESDVTIIDVTQEDVPKYSAINSLVEECLIIKNNKKLKYLSANPNWLDASALVKSKRIQLIKISNGYELIGVSDKLYVDEYFGEEYGESTKYLKKVEEKMFKNIKRATANRGCNIACIQTYKYRINKDLEMFNILIEYMCGKGQNNN